jgi:hypothetical protein
MNVNARIEKWLYSYLTADSTLNGMVGGRFYGPAVKTGTAFPYITWDMQSNTRVNGNAAGWLMTKSRFQVKVVAKGGMTDAVSAIADRLETLLDKREITANGITFSVLPVTDINYVVQGQDAEIRFLHYGGIFEFDAQVA